MTHNEQTRERFLVLLAETPFISAACKRAGISRATINRWMKDNYRFRKKILKALGKGRENLVDMAEVALVKKVQNGDLGAIKFFLSHNSDRYRVKSTDYEEVRRKEENPAAAFMGPDGMILMSKRTADMLKKKEEEERRRRNRAMGFPEPEDSRYQSDETGQGD